MSKEKIKIALDEEDFKTLVEGNVVCRLKVDKGIETDIILKDIGHDVMIDIILNAMGLTIKNKKDKLLNDVIEVLQYFDNGLNDVQAGSGEKQPMHDELKDVLTRLKKQMR